MAEPASNITSLPSSTSSHTSSDNSTDPLKIIKDRRSQELVIGLCGAIGSGVKNLKDSLFYNLKEHGYHVINIRLSELILEAVDESSSVELTGFDRYDTLQNKGDELRNKFKNSIVAELAVRKISVSRTKHYGDNDSALGALKVTEKVAYIVDQIKHPKEVELFREVYRNNFYMLGLLRTEDERRKKLLDEQISDVHIASLISRDRKSKDGFGQQVEKSLHLSDYFIRNIDRTEDLASSVNRFIKLIHGINQVTPTKDEIGIYSAFSASLKSACLSRQVGAAITDDNGVILSTGCNDVPKFGGGLYDIESKTDNRCFNHSDQICHNDKHKEHLKREFEQILKAEGVKEYQKVSGILLEESKAKSLIEYSRAVHAEMDAITALARGNNSTVNSTLYCTTYPCHICARHIVAAGIKRVVYIEPYEKSLAIRLHGDAIYHPENGSMDNKVVFQSFEGVAPKRYAKFFGFNQKRKDGAGKVQHYTVISSDHVDPQYLDSYGDYELKVVQILADQIPNIKEDK
jgi:deoxycytidylate deaminase